jgi:hypothetical protein
MVKQLVLITTSELSISDTKLQWFAVAQASMNRGKNVSQDQGKI